MSVSFLFFFFGEHEQTLVLFFNLQFLYIKGYKGGKRREKEKVERNERVEFGCL